MEYFGAYKTERKERMERRGMLALTRKWMGKTILILWKVKKKK